MKEEETTMDLLYTNPNPELRKEIEKLGGKIEDASDEIHEERVSIIYPKEKKKQFYELLTKFNVINNSLSFLVGK